MPLYPALQAREGFEPPDVLAGPVYTLGRIQGIAKNLGIDFAEQPVPGKALVPCDEVAALVVPSVHHDPSAVFREELEAEGYTVPDATVVAIIMTLAAYAASANRNESHIGTAKEIGATHVLVGFILSP